MSDPIKTRTEADAIHEIIRDSLNRMVSSYDISTGLQSGILVFQDKGIINLESFKSSPKRKRALVTTYDTASFINYVLAHRVESQTAIFLKRTQTGATFHAIIDYHPAGSLHTDAAWGEHNCQLVLETTPEWQRWTGSNSQAFGQEAFAEFLLDNRRDIIRPDAGILLDVARMLVAEKSVEFKSGVNLKNGANHLEFVENVEVRGVANRIEDAMDIPDTFVLGLVPFVGGDGVEIEAQLRFRISDRRLTFTYVLLQPHKVIEAAVQAARARVEAELGFVFYGSATISPPPAVR